MEIVDTHTHLYLDQFDHDFDETVRRSIENNIDYFQAKPVNIPKITFLLDNGYNPQ